MGERSDDEQARYRAELRRSGALRRALLQAGLMDRLAAWVAWLTHGFRRA
jgi:hypothetical protein